MLPPVFEEVVGQPFNRLAEEAREGGTKIIGITCSYVPEPLISVAGLQPMRMRAPGVAGTPMADTYLSSVICSYTRSLLEFALDGFYELLDGWVFTASCDHLRRLFDNLEYLLAPSFHHIIDLPHKLGDEALAWYLEELRLLAAALSARFDVDMGDQALLAAVRRQNEYLSVMRDIGELRFREHPPLTGEDFHKLVVAGASAPKEALLEPLRAFSQALSEDDQGIRDYRARLMVVGSQLDDPRYIRIIESMGGLVVADRFCLGSLPGLEAISEEGDPLDSLAEHYLRRTSCPRMMEEFDRRVEEIVQAATAHRVDGIVLQTMKFCDTWGVESSPLGLALREAEIPVLRVEREYALTGEGQLRTRIQAFLESMGR